ncbi:MAG: beta-class carbonic anhydrase, partial [Myxococcota bacterium]
TCMDARLETGRMLGLEEGDAHVIRNAGGIVTDDVIRSLMISQHLLGTREVLVIHHTGCGMIGLPEADLCDKLERETGQRPSFDIGAFADLESDVRDSVERIRSSPFVAEKEGIRGFVFEVETGRLREVS